MPQHELPALPNLEHLQNQARRLWREGSSFEAAALRRFAEHGITAAKPKLADALHVIAREYGFDTWPALKLQLDAASENALEALTAAVKADSAQVVRQVLDRHESLRCVINDPLPNNSFDTPALIAAVTQNNREMVDVLIEAGANINERSGWWAGGFGVLDLAPPELAAYLISRGASVDIHAAARLGMIDRVRELLALQPDLVHARGGDGQLPLHFASSIEIAELLLDHGADINARDIDHESTAAQYMAGSRQNSTAQTAYRHDVARFLISRGAQTDILMAAAIGDLGLVERILNHDPDTVRTTVSDRYFPKRNSKSGGTIYMFGFGVTKTPHMIAQQFGHTAVFELLMQRSAPWLRLTQMAETGDEARVRQIMQEHPSLLDRVTPAVARRMVGAAVRNNSGAVQLLLEQGWPSNATLGNNQTALHYAAWHGNLAMLRALLEHSAPVNVFETEHGGSPLAWALHGSLNSWQRDKGDYPEVVRALLAAGAAIPRPDRPLMASDEVLEIIQQAN